MARIRLIAGVGCLGRRTVAYVAIGCGLICASAGAADVPVRTSVPAVHESLQPKYFWRTTPMEGGAEILTLFCRLNASGTGDEREVPLVAILRDSLGDNDASNDRLRYVWLLSYVHPSWRQQALSAVPFVYWRSGDGQKPASAKLPKPLIDLSQPSAPLFSNVGRQILQWSLLDPTLMPVRASSRTYRTNELDDERLHLEEAIGYLREAPVSTDEFPSVPAPTRPELNTVIARLSLRTHMLGGLVSEQQAEKMGEADGFAQEIIGSRNMETLRECAEKTGLIFEPIDVAGHVGEYAVLWYPLDHKFERPSSSLTTVWKVLSISDPEQDVRVKHWHGPQFERALDSNGSLLPAGATGEPVQLIPLAVYGMSYPTKPLLLADFRDIYRVRGREMAQRLVDDTATGILGLSHFTNWYFFVGEAIYEFVRSHRGTAVNRLARMDSYSQFRVELALDHDLDPTLRQVMQKRVASMALNPLEVAPAREIAVADARYAALTSDAGAGQDSKLGKRLAQDRRVELAEYGNTQRRQVSDEVLHRATFGMYARRVKENDLKPLILDRDRRIDYNLAFLDGLVKAGTNPEVSYPVERIRESVITVAELTPGVAANNVREHATATIESLKAISTDSTLQADCTRAAEGIKAGRRLLNLDASLSFTK